MTRPRRAGAVPVGLAAALLTAALAAVPVAAQPPDPAALDAARAAAADAHLLRVGAWGLTNAVGGLVLWRAADGDARRGFGLQAGLWGAVNLGIATVGLLASGDGGDPAGWAEAVRRERGYHDVLLFNLGLNVAYTAVGATLLAAGYRDVRSEASWRGHGTALIVQGLGLLVLDGVAFAGSRARLADLLAVPGGGVGFAAPGGLRLVIGL